MSDDLNKKLNNYLDVCDSLNLFGNCLGQNRLEKKS